MKHIILTIRDYDPEISQDLLKNKLNDMIVNAWNKIPKTNEFEDFNQFNKVSFVFGEA